MFFAVLVMGLNSEIKKEVCYRLGISYEDYNTGIKEPEGCLILMSRMLEVYGANVCFNEVFCDVDERFCEILARMESRGENADKIIRYKSRYDDLIGRVGVDKSSIVSESAKCFDFRELDDVEPSDIELFLLENCLEKKGKKNL